MGATPNLASQNTAAGPPLPRRIGTVNWAGLWSHYKRGLIRYFHYAATSIGGPVITGLMFLAVFTLALGDAAEARAGLTFIAPGIVMVMLIHQGFQHAAFLILDDKLEGMIADPLMAPLSPLEVMAGYVLSAAVTALITGAAVLIAMLLFVDLPVTDLAVILGYSVLGALLFAVLGALIGLWADKWEHYAAAENFLILPLGVLSGAFFSLDSVPQAGQYLIALNPVFYLIDGFRAGFVDSTSASATIGLTLLVTLTVVLGWLTWRLFAIGYKIKP